MLPIRHLTFMASVTVLWSTAISAATIGNQANVDAVIPPSFPFRLDNTTSVTPMFPKAREHTMDDTDLEDRTIEERMKPLIGASDVALKLEESISDVSHSLMKRVETSSAKLSYHDHAAEKLATMLKQTYKPLHWKTLEHLVDQDTIIQEKFVQLLHDMLLTQHDSSFDGHLVRYLAKPASTNVEEKPLVPLANMVKAFHSLREFHDMKARADNMQRVLAVARPETVELMFPVWLKSELDPEIVYEMMPIAEEKILTDGVWNRARWDHIREKLKPWIEYHIKYAYQFFPALRRQTHEDQKMNPFIRQYLATIILRPLVRESEPVDLVEFLECLQEDKDLVVFSRAMQLELLDHYRWESQDIMFEKWSKANVKPEEVYHSMPISMDRGDRYKHFTQDLKQWMRYADMYQTYHHDYQPDYANMIGLLMPNFRFGFELEDALFRFEDNILDMKEHAQGLIVARQELSNRKDR